jgi:hypothetical protein
LWNNLPIIGPVIRRATRSLTAKILIAFAVVVLVGIGGVAILANDRTTAAFEHYLQGSGPDVDKELSNVVALVYGQDKSWDRVARVLSAMPGPPDQRVIVVDSTGRVVADTRGTAGGVLPPLASLSAGQAIEVDGKVI